MYEIICGFYGCHNLVIYVGYMLVMSMFYGKIGVWFSTCFYFQMNVQWSYDLIDDNADILIEQQCFLTNIR